MAGELQSNEFWKKKANRAMQVRDTNRDGKISLADFNLVIERYKQMGASEEHIQRIIELSGKTSAALGFKDESIEFSYEEFAALLFKLYTSQDEDQRVGAFKAMFSVIDSKKKGEFAIKEWTEYHKALGINTEYAKASFEAMDVNSDGSVSEEEFIPYVNEFFFSTEDKLNSSILYGPLDKPLD